MLKDRTLTNWTKLESVYRSATVVANICVHAATDRNKPIAIIVPAEPALKKLARENGVEGNGIEDLVHSKKLNGIILNEMQAAGKAGGLAGIEIIDGVVMSDEEWNAANVRRTLGVLMMKDIVLTNPTGLDDSRAKDQSKGAFGQVSERHRPRLCCSELRTQSIRLALQVG